MLFYVELDVLAILVILQRIDEVWAFYVEIASRDLDRYSRR